MERKESKSAILLGAGPSLYKNNHLKLLANSNYTGLIMIPEIIAKKTLESGITPDKFNISYFTLEENFDVSEFLNYDIVLKYAKNITVYCSSRTIEKSKAFIERHFRRMAQIDRKEANETSNVGLFMLSVVFHELDINHVCLVGMDHATHEWETEKIDCNSEIYKLCFKEIYNTFSKTIAVLNPIHQVWYEQFYYFVEKYFKDVTIINCTEGGSLTELKQMRFKDWLA